MGLLVHDRSMAWMKATALLVALVGCDRAAGEGNKTPGKPVETRPPNAAWQKPAHAGQTRAPFDPKGVAFDVVVVAKGLEHPWGMAFLPDGSLLVTERGGKLRVIEKGRLGTPVKGLPEVAARGQGGLLDVALDPKYAENNLIYWSYSEPRPGGNGTAVARGKLVLGAAPTVEDVQVIWGMTPTLNSPMHFGSRLVFRPDGTLFITTGERAILEGRHQAQRLDGTLGKVVRINPDGSIPKDNPLANRMDARPEIWSWGHRNLQAAAINPRTGALWTVEHGARGGDEVNAPEAGKDYGWPTITYGIEYNGDKIGEGRTQAPGMEQPIYYWDPVIAPSGMAFYEADLFPAWKGSLFVGGLAGKHVARLSLDGNRVVGEERLLADRARIRDVRVGPEGALYLLTDDGDDAVLKLVPKGR